MKVLLVSDVMYFNNFGAGVLIDSLYYSLKTIYSEKNIHVVALPYTLPISALNPKFMNFEALTKKDYLKNVLQGNIKTYSNHYTDRIISIINEKQYDIIILCRSEWGKLTEKIRKRTNAKVVVLYISVVSNSVRELFRLEKSNRKKIMKIPYYFIRIRNEKLSSYNAHMNIVLNKREEEMFIKYYKKTPEMTIPVFFKDSYSAEIRDTPVNMKIKMDHNKLNLLFVGSYFWANIVSIEWFAKNVVSNLESKDYDFFIVGRGTEKFLNHPSVVRCKNIHLVGEVPTLREWYESCDVVIAPLIEGDGMKTKTAEALMYGKYFLGTKEALLGYEKLKLPECNSPDEFKSSLQRLKNDKPDKFNESNRKMYEINYSASAIGKILEKKFNELIRR